MHNRPRPLVVSLAASALVIAVFAPTASAQPGNDGQPSVRVIVQLVGPPALRNATRGAGAPRAAAQQAVETGRVRAAQRDLLSRARAVGVDAKPERLITDLVNAVALTVPTGEVDDLRGLRDVRAVYPDEAMHVTDDAVNELVGAPQVWQRTDAQGRSARGAGVTVAVVDTGVDYTHPDLGGGLGTGHKVVGGYDLVNDDADPMDDNGHGTHVAGIIAADGGVTGVAPEATLTSYKVLDRSGNGYESDVIAGLDAAVAPDNPNRADVVNLSLSGPGDGTDPLGQAATAATQAGVVVVAAAGNSGPAKGTVGSPAVADGVLSVGASISGLRLPQAYIESPTHELLQSYRVVYSANPPEQPVTGELVDVGQGRPQDYDRVGDVSGKVVAYRASLPQSVDLVSPSLIAQARLAEDRGAIALIGYTTSSGPVFAPSADAAGTAGVVDVPARATASGDSFRMDKLVVLGVRPLQWQELTRYLGQAPVRISVSGQDVTDRVAAFSSQGPTPRYTLAPDLVAPGVEIESTWPTAQWAPGVARLSGTSMASPAVAGAAALLRQLRPDDSAADVRAELVGSAKGLDGYGPTIEGAGRLDIAAAANAAVTASPATLSFGMADLGRRTIGTTGTVQLHNHADHPVDVSLTAGQAPGSPGTAEVSPSQASIAPGGTLEVTVRVAADRPAIDTDLAGWLVGHVAGSPDVRVPYLLAARPLLVRSSPDPSDGSGQAFVYSPAVLAGAPVLTVTPPHGPATTVPTTLDHGTWYRTTVNGKLAGAYRLTATAQTADGLRLVGTGSVEVLPPDNRHGAIQWEPVGPNGAAGAIATTPADTGTAAIAQYTKAGPWITTDAGQTWRQVDRLPVAGGTGTAVVAAGNPRRMWYAVDGTSTSAVLDPTYQGKVLRSDDTGHSWQALDFPDAHIYAFVADSGTRTLVAVLGDSVEVSRDGGDTWSAYALPVAGGDLTGAAMGDGDLFLSTVGGVWALRAITSGPPSIEQVYSGKLRGMVADDQLVALLTMSNAVVGSSDGARTWATLQQLPSFGPWSISMRDGTIMVATLTGGNWVSRDHGSTWASLPQPVSGAIETDVAPWADGRLLFSSEKAGLFATAPDGSEPTRIGVPGVTAYDLAISAGTDGEPMLIAGSDADVYRTALPTGTKITPDATEWGLSGSEAHVGTRVAQVEASGSEPGVVWKVRKDALDEFWVYRSADGGKTWQQRGRDSEVPYGLAVSPVDGTRVVVPFASLQGNGLYVAGDAGTTWKKLFHDETFTTVAADPRDPDRLWLGSTEGLYRSDDFGTTVTRVAAGPVTTVHVDGQQVVAGGSSVQVSTDGGQTFRTADTGGLPLRVSDLVVSPTAPNTLYAATTSYAANGLPQGGRGVLRSTDGGQTWLNVSGGLDNRDVASLAISPDGQWLFAGTVQGGVHRLRLR